MKLFLVIFGLVLWGKKALTFLITILGLGLGIGWFLRGTVAKHRKVSVAPDERF